MIARTLGALVVAVCATGSAVGASAPALKPIDPVALQAMVEGTAKELLLPGAMVLLKTPQGNFAFGYRMTELGVTNPPRADIHFRPASNTKTMTAAVIVQLIQEGKLSFDDLISKYVDGVPNGDQITIRQLIKMRSGLYNFTNAPELAENLVNTPDKAWTSEEVLAMAFKRPPHFAPGAEFEYNNTNYYLLGLVAEKIDGKPLATIFQERLFGPLGMKNTLLPVSTSNTIPEPYAHGYIYGGASYALVDAPYPDDLQAAARAGTLKPDYETWQNPSAYFAAGGVISTADDLATWMRALVGGQVFNADYQRQMGHDPDNDVTLIVWTSLTLSLDGKPTANALMLKILDQIYAVSPLAPAKL
ncbi:beta-lactamase family protein [Mesorhizobium sp. M1423]|uniref:serine hydrolase domain-containing protein n=1 Tax=Mesorhizobium sp. M1423 TaxID=2957101 RepID=UPI003337F545